MAEGARTAKPKRRRARRAPPAPALPIELPAAMFSGPGLLALADMVPVMTAFIDRDQRYRFINKALAEWLEIPRREMLGKTMREVVGAENYAARRPMLEAAMGGERE